jgi:hypothetical protein
MRTIIRIILVALATVSAGFIWTVGQAGLAQTNRNLCDLWASLPLPSYKACAFQNSLVYAALGGAAILLIWGIIEVFLLVRRAIRKRRTRLPMVTARTESRVPASAPNLICSFNMNDSGCVHHNIPCNETITQPGQTSYVRQTKCDWYRIRVDAKGGNVAGCRGRLVSIKRGGNELLAGEHPPLPFTHYDPDAPVTVSEGVSEFLDLLGVTYDQSVILAVPPHRRSSLIHWWDLFSLPGDYEIKAAITTPSATMVPIELSFRWNLNHATAEIVQRHALIKSNTETQSPVLKLSVGMDAEYYDVPKGGLYSFTKRFKVKLENLNTHKAITQGKVQILSIEPFCGYRGPWLVEQEITLAAGDHKFLPLAQYNELREPEKGMKPEDTFVINSVESRDHHKPLLGTETKHIVILRATAFDAPYSDIKCRLWVDKKGRFQIEEI